jgi:hypothetical protein
MPEVSHRQRRLRRAWVIFVIAWAAFALGFAALSTDRVAAASIALLAALTGAIAVAVWRRT